MRSTILIEISKEVGKLGGKKTPTCLALVSLFCFFTVVEGVGCVQFAASEDRWHTRNADVHIAPYSQTSPLDIFVYLPVLVCLDRGLGEIHRSGGVSASTAGSGKDLSPKLLLGELIHRSFFVCSCFSVGGISLYKPGK